MNVVVGTRQARSGETERITNPQSAQGDRHGISTNASCLNHGGGGGTDLSDKPVTVNGSSSKIHAAC